MKKLMAGIMLLVFGLTLAFTVVFADPPGCRWNCKKSDCPPGFCYVDCVSCCYISHGQVYCFK